MNELDLRAVNEEINKKVKAIPDYFFVALAGELFSVFGDNCFESDKDFGCPVSYMFGTGGFGAAFNMACRKLDMMWLSDYRDQLVWYELDKFDSIIIESVIGWVENPPTDPLNSYYSYLLRWDKE